MSTQDPGQPPAQAPQQPQLAQPHWQQPQAQPAPQAPQWPQYAHPVPPAQPPYPAAPQQYAPQQAAPPQWQQPQTSHSSAPQPLAARPGSTAAVIALILLVIDVLGSLVQPFVQRYGYEVLGSAAYSTPIVLHYLFVIAALILAIVAVASKRSPRPPIAYIALGGAAFILADSLLSWVGFSFAFSLPF